VCDEVGLIEFDLAGVKAAADAVTAAAERLSTVSGKVGGMQCPPMRPEDRSAVQAALSAGAEKSREPVGRLRAVAGEMRARCTLLWRDMQERASTVFGTLGLVSGVWVGSDQALEATIARVKKKYSATGERLEEQLKKHQRIGRGRGRVTKTDKAILRQLRKDKKLWGRWLKRVDALKGGRWARALGRLSRVLGNPAVAPALDFLTVALGSPMIDNTGSKVVAGSMFAAGQSSFSVVPGGSIFALVDSIGMATLGDHGYRQVSIGNMNQVTAQTIGAFDQAIRTGDYSALEDIHQLSMDGKTTMFQTTGAYIGEAWTSDDVAAFHDESFAGQHGEGAQNVAVAGETIHQMVTHPLHSIGDAVDYWNSF